ncbi:hypothetical protein [Neisseria leonii]|uniref:hypothetical protein n=1 Tax=Neisseria leonii TaxID=2995413 RepID=UPI00237A2923|nr:hypothetical protein [Neisseria sp. 3986]MDD9325655.1 hypothetical protein [Neisseria sp. 3986]
MKYYVLIAVVMLAGCATPQQRAAYEMQQHQQAQALQVALAGQCDAPTADLMRRQFAGDTGQNEQEKQAFRLAYLDKVGDPMFRSCYRMAWESYTAQQRLEDLRHRDYYDDWWYGPRPWGWWRRW